jgi:CDP-glycerol glycerophosphotransferase
VYGVADFLPACLDSILGGAAADLEVIAVDDASADTSGSILAERAARDPRLRVVRLSRNHGAGHARNVGLERATGDYVWFVDGDDFFADGGLAAVAEALKRLRPDVLLINWESCYPSGRTEPNPGAHMLSRVPAAGCTLAERPDLIELTMTAWSKLFRRDFLTGLGVGFGGGIHEDIQVTCAALLSAREIGAVDRVCYQYRRDRPGAAMATAGPGHLGVFAAYDRVFAMLAGQQAAGRPVSPGEYAAIFERAMAHYAAVLEARGPRSAKLGASGLVPRAERRDFFYRMHEDFILHRPGGYEYARGPRGVRLRLVARGAFGPYALLAPVNRLRLALQRLIKLR